MAAFLSILVATDKLTFRPFVQLPNRGPSTWAVSDQGKRWIIERIPVYDDVRGPRGVKEAEAATSKRKKQKDWKKRLASDYMDNWPDFDWKEVVGENASQSTLRVAQKVCLHFYN